MFFFDFQMTSQFQNQQYVIDTFEILEYLQDFPIIKYL